MSSCDIIASPRMPSFPLPGPAGNELAQQIAFIGGNVGGQGHTCVHYTGACVSVLKWGTKIGRVKSSVKITAGKEVAHKEHLFRPLYFTH